MNILIIDDDQSMLDFLNMSLEEEGYAVDTASDGEQGLSLAQAKVYDLIILDYVLPKIDGKQVCQSIRAKHDVPIIMLTVMTEISSKIELLDLGADDYMCKPFSYEELRSRIQAILRRPREIRGKTLNTDDIVLDKDKHRVTRDDHEIHLTRKEFCLLEYFMRNKGRVLSRNMILEHVWDLSADPSSNTVEAHVTNLRRKLFSPESKEVIHTVKGVGYKLE